MSPLMISPGQGPLVEPEASTSVWVERAGQYAAQAVANAERAHERTVEKRLDGPTLGWTAERLTRSYRGSADGERRYREEADVLTLRGYQGWLETSDADDPLGARILLALHFGGLGGYPGRRSGFHRRVTWTKAPTT